MTPARLQTVEEIFHAALDQEPDRVGAFLDAACEGDEALRRKVEALLASHQRAGSFIETTVAGITTRIIENEQADLLVGRTIGHYKISKRIGTGGMGDVYLATDVTAGRKAALKLLPTRFTSDAQRLKRFQQEERALVGLNHPNILTVYEIGEDHSTHYIASELIEGETLRQRLVRGRMELREAVDVAIQVASALAAAHETGIVHRDIKPENIMLRPDGYVKVLDFGIAKLAESAFAGGCGGRGRIGDTRCRPIWARYWEPFVTCRRNRRAARHVDKTHRYLESRRSPLRNGNGACAIHRRHTKRGDVCRFLRKSRRRSRVTSRTRLLSFSRLSAKHCAKIARNDITARTSCFTRSKSCGANWNSNCNAPLLLYGCAGHNRRSLWWSCC